MNIEFSDADIKIIKSAKNQGTKLTDEKLAEIGDILLSNIKL